MKTPCVPFLWLLILAAPSNGFEVRSSRQLLQHRHHNNWQQTVGCNRAAAAVGCLTATVNGHESAEKQQLMSASFQSLANRYFQLEEMEDADKCITEIYLNADQTVAVGVSDGPRYQEATGRWSIDVGDDEDQNGIFSMSLDRSYESGRDNQHTPTNIGTFTYNVQRKFTGTVKTIGNLAAVEGVIHLIDEVLGDEQVGYFEMIDTTAARTAALEDQEAQ